MKPFNARTCLLSAALSLTAGLIHAQAPSQGKNGASGNAMQVETRESGFKQQFARLDADGNGHVTWNEAYAVRVKEFVEMDASKDGIVDRSEYGKRKAPMSQFDSNADGKLELSEYIGQHRQRFRKADANQDGSLSLQEYARAQQAMRKQ